MTHRKTIKLKTKGICDVQDVTGEVEEAIAESKIKEGIVVVQVTGSTAGVTTIEHEPHLLNDLARFYEEWIPKNAAYEHGKAWNDDNGFSHLRASLMGPSVALSVHNGKLETGTWQQVVVVDFDNRPRSREVVIRVVGE